MKKLKHKIFFVIFVILTIFLITILLIVNYQNYNQEYRNIESILGKIKQPLYKDNSKDMINENNKPPHFFIDSNIYIIAINKEDLNVISYSYENYDELEIKEFAQNIIDEKNYGTHINNLYLNKYSYNYTNENSIIILENTKATNKIILLLKTSIIIFILLEIIIIIISYLITNWLIKPVIENFNYQKRFIADASHELKTPLTVILANADMAISDPKQKKWINNIQSEAERMNKLVIDLLTLAQLEDKKDQITLEKNNISKIIELAILPFESLMYEKKIKYHYNIIPNIYMKCNSDKIKQLLSILIDNAIKHTKSNKRIEISLNENKKDITIKVSNEGDEIPKSAIEHIFERFFRVDTSRNRDENCFGLGLSIAKEIVTIHNGKIEVESSSKITTFKITFKRE